MSWFNKKRKAKKEAIRKLEIREAKLSSMKPIAQKTLEETSKVLSSNPTDVDWASAYIDAVSQQCTLFDLFPQFCKEVGFEPYEVFDRSRVYLSQDSTQKYWHSVFEWNNYKEDFSKKFPVWKAKTTKKLYDHDDLCIMLYWACRKKIENVKKLASLLLKL